MIPSKYAPLMVAVAVIAVLIFICLNINRNLGARTAERDTLTVERDVLNAEIVATRKVLLTGVVVESDKMYITSILAVNAVDAYSTCESRLSKCEGRDIISPALKAAGSLTIKGAIIDASDSDSRNTMIEFADGSIIRLDIGQHVLVMGRRCTITYTADGRVTNVTE